MSGCIVDLSAFRETREQRKLRALKEDLRRRALTVPRSDPLHAVGIALSEGRWGDANVILDRVIDHGQHS